MSMRRRRIRELEAELKQKTELLSDIRYVLKSMDMLLVNLPEENIHEFARSEYFEVYKRIFDDLGIQHENDDFEVEPSGITTTD